MKEKKRKNPQITQIDADSDNYWILYGAETETMSRRYVIIVAKVLGVVAVVAVLGFFAAFLNVDHGASPAHTVKNGSPSADEFDFSEPAVPDSDAAPPIDPALVKYREVMQMPVPLESIRALAVGTDDRIYVAGDQAVAALQYGGDTIGTEIIELPGKPRCLAVADRLYVGTDDRVITFEPKGKRTELLAKPAAVCAFTSLAVAESDLFVADARNRIVWHYDLHGKLLGRIGAPDPARKIPGLLVTNRYFDVAAGTDGLLYVVNPRRRHVEAYTYGGDLEFSWGEGSSAIEGFFGCCNPAHLAILPDGRFVTAEKGAPRIKIFTAQGKFECVVAGPAEMNAVAAGLAVDHRGRVLALDPVARCVRVFARKEKK
jgi:hypothetical protein